LGTKCLTNILRVPTPPGPPSGRKRRDPPRRPCHWRPPTPRLLFLHLGIYADSLAKTAWSDSVMRLNASGYVSSTFLGQTSPYRIVLTRKVNLSQGVGQNLGHKSTFFESALGDNSWPARPGACRRFERGAGSFLYSGPVGIRERSGATRKQCLGGREAQWPGMKKNITRLLFRRAFFTQKGSSTRGAIKSCAMTTRGRTAVPRGSLRVLGTLALPVLGTLKGTLRVPKGILRVPKGILRVPFY
jgi:hypothetical protein